MPSKEYKTLLDSAWDLHVAKNAGYAGADNPDPWANFRMSEDFGVSAFRGSLVRMSDKYIRITNLLKDPTNERVGESLRDTLRDLSAYALIAICLMDEETKAIAIAEPEPEPDVRTRFMCGHYFGDEPIPYGQDNNCGTEVHWSRVNGIELVPSAEFREV